MYRIVLILSLIVGALGVEKSFLDGDFDIADGVRLVSIPVDNEIEDSGRSLYGVDSPFYRMARFLQGHELHVKLPNLIEKDKVTELLAESLRTIDETNKENAVTGRKKGGGGTGIALLGLMMAKTMGAIGIGGLGLLTLKALMVSALALLLSAIVGLKKLSSHDEGGHEVYHVTAGHHHDHHRKRRQIYESDLQPLPYKGWTQYKPLAQNV